MATVEMKEIPLSQIREAKDALRGVHTDTEDYQGLVDSIRSRGVKTPILVRPKTDADSGEQYYELVNGLQRFTASKDVGLDSIPARIEVIADEEVIVDQIITNIHTIETKPVEYSQALQKILMQKLTMTESELGAMLSKSGAWVKQRLGLLKLHESIQPLVDEGKINLSNAYALAKLDPEDQLSYVDRAQTETPNEFISACDARRKEVNKARRQGVAVSSEFEASPHLQKLSTFKDEYRMAEVGPALCTQAGLSSEGLKGFALAVSWALHLDPQSVAEAKAKHDDRQKALKDKKDKAKAARLAQRQEVAQLKAARLQVEADATEAGEDVEEALAAFDRAHAPQTQEESDN